jgi:hypothetical protein
MQLRGEPSLEIHVLDFAKHIITLFRFVVAGALACAPGDPTKEGLAK